MPDQEAPGSSSPDLLGQVAAVSLRLMAGSVPRRVMDTLQRTLHQSPGEYPWQQVNAAILADEVPPQELLAKGLRAQRDWILRGGRETPGPTLSNRGKGFLAKILAQLIFFALFAVVFLALLLLLKFRWPEADVYRLLEWFRATFPGVFGR